MHTGRDHKWTMARRSSRSLASSLFVLCSACCRMSLALVARSHRSEHVASTTYKQVPQRQHQPLHLFGQPRFLRSIGNKHTCVCGGSHARSDTGLRWLMSIWLTNEGPTGGRVAASSSSLLPAPWPALLMYLTLRLRFLWSICDSCLAMSHNTTCPLMAPPTTICDAASIALCLTS